MRVLFVASEAVPWVKTGGLADVAGALPAALCAAGHDVRLVLPFYRQLREKLRAGKEAPGEPNAVLEGPIAATFLPFGERAEELRVWRLGEGSVAVSFLDIPSAFERDTIYGADDDSRRFVMFARGVLAYLQHLREVEGWQPDVVHCNDWHTALVINYIRTSYAYTFGHLATVFTIHNLAYQGQFHPGVIADAGLGGYGLVEDRLGPGIAHSFNFMARGILYADAVTTVSPSYAAGILTPEFGERLDGVLRRRQHDLHGILNGIDTAQMNPASDLSITANYSVDSIGGKSVCKADLQRKLGLAVNFSVPLMGAVTRLVEQKGPDLLYAVMPWLLRETDAQFVLLGSGDSAFEDAFRHLARVHPERVAVRIGFDAALAQQIYAGSDMFLMPSRFEPCGLSQLVALRYGSVPVVRATGGLADTVREGWDGNGFRFHPFETGHFIDAIRRALAAFGDADGWSVLRARGMREDHSWAHAAEQYAAVYRKVKRTR